MTGWQQRSHAEVGVLSWKTTQSEYLRSLPSSPTERWMRLSQRCASDGYRAAAAQCGVFSIAMTLLLKKACGQQNNIAPTWLARVGAGYASKVFLIRRGLWLSVRRRPAPLWSLGGDAACAASV